MSMKERQVVLVTQAYQSLLGIEGIKPTIENADRLEEIREKAFERLSRRLDKLSQEVDLSTKNKP